MTQEEKLALVRALQPVVSRVRTDISAIKYKDREGKTKQAWTDEALTEGHLAKHVNGVGPARGCCPIKAGEDVTMVALFDLDSHKGEIPWSDMAEWADKITQASQMFGLEPIPFRSSGGNGIHLIYLWDEPQDAYSVRQTMKMILESLGLRDGATGLVDGAVEIFPKQDKVPAGGKGSQFILPLAGMSEPLIPMLGYEPAGKDYAVNMAWPVSEPVAKIEKPVRAVTTVVEGSVELATLRSALAAIPNEDENELDYDDWRNIIFAIHAETGGDEEGLALAHEFSARSSKYDPDFLDNRVWPYITDREGGVTGRTILAKAKEFGWQEDISGMFEVLSVETDENGQMVEELPAFRRNRQGDILADLDNIILGMNSFAVSGCYIAWDEFRGMVVMTEQRDGAGGWRPIEDHDAVAFRLRLERVGFKPISREMMRDVIKFLSNQNKFDSAILWGRGLKWDGVKRIDTFLERYFGVADKKYARALSRYLWTALAGRLVKPGIKADIALILIGLQGAGKSTAVAALAPFDDWFCELDLSADDDKKARMLRGKLVSEFGELRGMYNREVEHIKAFMSRQFEEWVPKFIEYATRYYRRAVFIGTSNEDKVLVDRTGNRRWAPVRVGAVDVEAIRRDREQLWAEAIQLFEAEGILFQETEELARAKHAEHMQEDAWSDAVAAWLNQEDENGLKNGRRKLKVGDVARGALLLDSGRINRGVEMRLANVMKDLGFEKRHSMVGSVWVKENFGEIS